MTVRYVGIGGNDANDGLSWANRKLTLNGAENTPVEAGDTVYVGPGTYRELLTCDVSGGAGAAISYIGDYDGTHTTGVKGIVRVTGSDDDLTATRASCITATSKNLRTFRGFAFGMTTGNVVSATTSATWIIEQCMFIDFLARINAVQVSGASQAAVTVRNCAFVYPGSSGVYFQHSADVSDAGHVVENCLIIGARDRCIGFENVGGATVRNCAFLAIQGSGVQITAALAAGQSVAVNNCIFARLGGTALAAAAVGEIVEDYNTLSDVVTARANTNAGANSLTTPPLFDARWFFEAVNGGNMVTPFDLSSASKLIDVAGTSPTTTDMRGTAVQGAQREWGALEYNSALLLATLLAVAGAVFFRAPIASWCH